MKVKERLHSIGVVIPSLTDVSDILLAHFLDILYPISEPIYVIAGSATPRDYDRVHIYRVKYKRGANIVTEAANYIRLQFGISYRLAKISRNVDLWIFFLGGEGLLLPMLTAKVLRRKVMLALAGYLEREGKAKQDILYKPLALAKEINCALSDKIVVYSERLVKEWGLEKYRNKILISHGHFLDFSKFKIQKPLSKRDNLIGYIGRLSQEKGILNFMKAIPELFHRRGDVSFLIGGDGQLRTKVDQYLSGQNLSSKVNFVGWIPHDELPKYLDDLNLLVLPSYTEGLPNTMLEAMACGTPVLATPVGAIPDVIKDGETGFIMEDNSPGCIVKNVIRVLNSPDLERITENARALVKKEFTYEVAVEKYRNIIEKSLG